MKLSFYPLTTATLFMATMGVIADNTYNSPPPADSSLSLLTSPNGEHGVVIEDYLDSSHRKANSTNIETHCSSSIALQVQLSNGTLTDNEGRIGCIDSKNEFQFDGPPSRSGYACASGWAVDDGMILYLGQYDNFYRCGSGDSVKMYYHSIDGVDDGCSEIQIRLVGLTGDC
ncbi:unnamed protein product [Ambrosiozyma monospora]|uniref:Unnamed protein product n=1 Tax=Ambrosiozyma monospora TaxID=43982 RepID=A0ACB5T517_AMBMO|nr:unnamed protein product [Ambrosiozyma monospora]